MLLSERQGSDCPNFKVAIARVSKYQLSKGQEAQRRGTTQRHSATAQRLNRLVVLRKDCYEIEN